LRESWQSRVLKLIQQDIISVPRWAMCGRPTKTGASIDLRTVGRRGESSVADRKRAQSNLYFDPTNPNILYVGCWEVYRKLSAVTQADAQPTASQQQVYEDLATNVNAQIKRLNDVMRTNVPVLNKMEGSGYPRHRH